MKLEAHAKINTVLDVTKRRPDGYHEVDMVLTELCLHDDVELFAEGSLFGVDAEGTAAVKTVGALLKGTGSRPVVCPQITVTVTDENGAPIPGIPTDERNIAVKAAHRFLEELACPAAKDAASVCSSCGDAAAGSCPAPGKTDLPEKLQIRLTKRIPAAAGLAGGSADAAAVLKGLNELLGAGLSQKKLCEIGLKVGADVPYCICGGTMRAQGIGEKLTRLSAMPKIPVLLVKPSESVSTREIYEALDPILESGQSAGLHPDVSKCLEIFPRTGTAAGLSELSAACGNILELVTAERLPVIKEIENRMRREGALCAMMSGSGPTVFGLFADEAARDKAAESFAGGCFGEGLEIRRTETA